MCIRDSRSVYQIVVPTTLRPQLLQRAHDGHLGVYKTRSSRLRHFFWPSIFRVIGKFCRRCDICQCLGKGKKPVQAPLCPCVLVLNNLAGRLPTSPLVYYHAELCYFQAAAASLCA